MNDFVYAAEAAEVPDPGSALVEVEGRLVVLIHAAGRWYALDDVCTHDGGPLSDGAVMADPEPAGPSISCPRHGARFHAGTGKPLTMPATQATVAHEVRVEGERVLVRLSD